MYPSAVDRAQNTNYLTYCNIAEIGPSRLKRANEKWEMQAQRSTWEEWKRCPTHDQFTPDQYY